MHDHRTGIFHQFSISITARHIHTTTHAEASLYTVKIAKKKNAERDNMYTQKHITKKKTQKDTTQTHREI
jgi:hypothetical protein